MYTVKEIDAKTANNMVKKYHYSGKVVSNSCLHLGLFDENNTLVGVLQYGYPMNGKKTSDKILQSDGYKIYTKEEFETLPKPKNEEGRKSLY